MDEGKEENSCQRQLFFSQEKGNAALARNEKVWYTVNK